MSSAVRRTLGHLDLDHRVSRRHRQQVRQASPWWEVGSRGDTLAPAASTSDVGEVDGVDVVVRDLRRIVRDVLVPCGVAAFGVVVVETSGGLVAVTASGRRIATRRLGPGPRDCWAPSAPPVEECRVLRIDAPRPRTAGRGDPWPC